MRRSDGLNKAALVRVALCVFIAAVALVGRGCAPMSYPRTEYAGSWVSDYEYLARYGEWIRIPRYDLVWRPYVVADWAPFMHGHWVWTNAGWAWVSYEPFGELVYHYGYWDYSLRYGWVWIPDSVWWPARVQWYTFGNYCAWAPLPPPHMTWPDPWEFWDVNPWVVVDVADLVSPDVASRRIIAPRRTIDERDSRPPTLERVERATGRTMPELRIEREPLEMRREVTRPTTAHPRTSKAPLSRMVLPEREQEKVREREPQIERDVLVPRRTGPERTREQPETPPPPRRPEPPPERREPEKQPERERERSGSETRDRTRRR